jgi:hypothetical protein
MLDLQNKIISKKMDRELLTSKRGKNTEQYIKKGQGQKTIH